MYKVAINGFGRIGRNVMRAYFEGAYANDIQIVAVNDLGGIDINAHLLSYDTAHGPFSKSVEIDGDQFIIDGVPIKVFKQADPAKLPWAELGVDVVLECTGFFTDKEKAGAHITAGAKKVLLSAPGKNMDATIVHGVNHHQLNSEHTIISNASCTTNCLAPIVQALHNSVGVEKGFANTMHSYTNDQRLTDVYHSDPLRARAAAQNMIPTKTGAAAAIGLVIPELVGKLDGMAVRVPTLNVSLLDLTIVASRSSSVEQINQILQEYATDSRGVLAINQLPLVSSDFNHNPASSIADITQTKVNGELIKVLAWYDNEWGFSNRMLDNVLAIQATA
ncbi:MAG: type I glyceraldehyde-3-phosphate dehydrogenase [Arenicella sp.]